jgi:Na+-transporting NADH:ubiquinone oxidoreductase subunit C
MKKDSMGYTVLFTFIVCVFFVFFLALANMLTIDKVEANRRFFERSAVLSALGIPFSNASEVDSIYEKSVTTSGTGADELFRAEVNGQVRFATRFAGPGLWGTIYGIFAVDAAVDRVAGLQIVSHNETPGLGGRIDESWFKKQFIGEKIGPNGIRVRVGSGKGDGDPENSEVDAVTGASRTSQSIDTLVNSKIAAFRKMRDAGGLK